MNKPRSLSLAAYRVLSWGVPQLPNVADTPRPEGEVLWVHVSTPDRLRSVDDLCLRLQPARPGLSVLMTAPTDADLSEWEECGFQIVSLPAEQPGAACAFLDHWRPDIALWFGGGLMPNLVTRAQEQGTPMILLDAEVELKTARGGWWLPDITRYTLDCFTSILAPTEEIARQIRRLGILPGKISVAPPLHISPNPQPWPEDELIETNHALAGRPVWLAAWIQDKEFISVLSAHRQALRLLPRLALVLHVADTSEAAPLYKRLEAMDLRCANWDEGNPIEDTTQVILSALPDNLGLWQRVSSVTFMGSSLEQGMGGSDPLIAVALGSAVIHGPHVSKFLNHYEELGQVNAALTIKSATELGDGVVELLAPDNTADMALAGWKMVTENAPQADQLIELVQDMLDQRRADDART